MDRMACVEAPALPLQWLLRAHPDWAECPVVVVDQDRPQGVVRWANARARAGRILPGMRYAAAVSLCPSLRGGVAPVSAVEELVDALTRRLWCFSPRVAPSPEEPGVFWLDVSGLGILYPTLEGWAGALHSDLSTAGFVAAVAVGFTRFGTYAAARAHRGVTVFAAPEAERAHARQIALARLDIDPTLLETLHKLGVATLGGFLDLPPGGLRRRFGDEAEALHRRARGLGWDPLAPLAHPDPVRWSVALDHPEARAEALAALVAGALPGMLAALAARHERLATLDYRLRLDDGGQCAGELAAAVPTDAVGPLLALWRLRLEGTALGAGVVEVALEARGAGLSERQLPLFDEGAARRIGAAREALAKARAQLGAEAVVVARLREGHLPEARHTWEPLGELPLPHATPRALRPLVRRVHHPAIALPPHDRRQPDGWLIAGMADGPVEEVIGPHLVTGGWWTREIARAYYYVRTRSGRWLWIYHDQRRRRWFLQGEVQ